MANIVRRGEAAPATTGTREWDPFRMMRELLRFDPFEGFGAFAPTGEMERALGFAPRFDVKETKDAFVFKADLPGMKEQDLDISLTGNRLTVSGKREAEEHHEGDTWYAYERSHGTFTRAFTLPDGADADHVRADMKDGVLTLIVPKKPESQARKIKVGASTEKGKA